MIGPAHDEPSDHLTIKINVPVKFRSTPQTYLAVAERMAIKEARRAAEWVISSSATPPPEEDQRPPETPPVVITPHVPSAPPVYDECLSCQ